MSFIQKSLGFRNPGVAVTELCISRVHNATSQGSSVSALLRLGASGSFFAVGLSCALYDVRSTPGLYSLEASGTPYPNW